MAKPPKKPKPEDIETVPDAWERFEKAIDTVTRPSRRPEQNGILRDGDYFLVIGDKMRVAHPTSVMEDGSTTVDLYRNLDDYRKDRVMERGFTYRR